MNGVCCFDRNGVCGILTGDKHCEGCKFFKTAAQFQADYEMTEKLLKKKGLESYQAPNNMIRTRRRKDYDI